MSERPDPIRITVYGANDIEFKCGWRTGPMTESGVGIDAWEYPHGDKKVLLGGCCTRESAIRLRDFLNDCIRHWNESDG